MKQDINLIRRLAKTISRLKEEKIILSNRLIGDLGEYFAIKKFKLKRENTNGYDARDNKGRKVEIKTCCSTSRVPQYNFVMQQKDFSYAILVHLDNKSLLPKRYYKINYKTIIKHRTEAEEKYNRFDLNTNKFNSMKDRKEIVEYFP